MMIQVYVQTLTSLGSFIGDWIDVDNFDSSLNLLLENATEQMKEQGYLNEEVEEWEIVDYESDYTIDLRFIYQDIPKLKELNELLNDLESYQIDIVGFLLDLGYDLNQIDRDKIDEVRVYSSWDEAIDEFTEYYLQIPEDSNAHIYLDYQKIQRDLDIEGYTEYNGQVFYDL